MWTALVQIESTAPSVQQEISITDPTGLTRQPRRQHPVAGVPKLLGEQLVPRLVDRAHLASRGLRDRLDVERALVDGLVDLPGAGIDRGVATKQRTRALGGHCGKPLRVAAPVAG